MKKLKGNLHTHTIYSDGAKSMEEVVEIYKSLNYDFIAITDHDILVNDEYLRNIPKSDENFLVFQGLEITEDLVNGRHIGLIKGNLEKLYVMNHPSLYSLSINDVLKSIKLLSEKYKVDCIDVTHYGSFTPYFDTDEIPLPKIATDDAHLDGMFGNAWIEVEAEFDKDDILRNIKKGNFTKHFK